MKTTIRMRHSRVLAAALALGLMATAAADDSAGVLGAFRPGNFFRGLTNRASGDATVVVPVQHRVAARPAQSAGGSTSVTAELEKLFNENGQSMPPMRMQDLPYASTPQMDRVRKVATTPAAGNTASPQPNKPGLLGRMFGRFRRKPESDSAEPPARTQAATRPRAAPPIVTASGASSSGPSATRPSAAHPTRTMMQSQPGSRFPSGHAGIGRPGVSLRRPTPEPTPVQTAPLSRRPQTPARTVAQTQQVSKTNGGFVSPFGEAQQLFDNERPQLKLRQPAPVESADVTGFATYGFRPDFRQKIEWSTGDVRAYEHPDAAGESPFTGSHLARDHELSAAAESLLGDVADAFREFEKREFTGVASVPETDMEPLRFVSAEQRLAASNRESGRRTPASRWRRSLVESGRVVEAAKEDVPSVRGSVLLEAQADELRGRRHQTGFMGFCPVILRDRNELVDATDEYRAQFGLSTYHFSSEEARDKFQANPTRYAPVGGGADLVVLVNSGEDQPGSLRFARWYRNRLYLFQSRETMELFLDNPERLGNRY